MKLQERTSLWEETQTEKPAIPEGSHYTVPIQIEYEDDWNDQALEHRFPSDAQERVDDHPLTDGYPLDREGASTLTWETFMDTVAFPEKSIPMALDCKEEWTSADVRDALIQTLQDTILCGSFVTPNQEAQAGMVNDEHRSMMDAILDDEEEEL